MNTKREYSPVADLEPKQVWNLFAGMAATPRPSKREEAVRKFIREAVRPHGLNVREDAVGNMIVDVPASEGAESAAVTVLQAHLDMVCEKNNDKNHDFDHDPIELKLAESASGDGPIVSADGTTLGADNGIGVAMALAAAFSTDLRHGPLELLFTIDEEAGMTGAKALGPESFRGRRMLNLDSEEDDTIYIGCAGGCDTTLSWDLAAGPVDAGHESCSLTVAGLRGGHSGGDIHENRGNAVKLLVRTLRQARVEGLALAAVEGGNLRNAIPREARAVVVGPAGLLAALRAAAERVAAEAVAESAEQSVTMDVEQIPRSDVASQLSEADTKRILDAVGALPYGVLGMHATLAGLVETSNNVATISSGGSPGSGSLRVTVGTLTRSSCRSRLWETLDQIAAVGRLAGASVETANEYPGWEPNVDSPTLGVCRRVYERLFGAAPGVAAIHAGLECGVIGEQVGGMDTVSFGPRIEGAHSPEERVYVDSVRKCWKYLTAVLAELAST